MTEKIKKRGESAWQLLASREPDRKIVGKKEGFHLPNSVTEDVGGFSLVPTYSVKQLRTIRNRQRGKRQREIWL